MKTTVKWMDDAAFRAEAANGCEVIIDGSPDIGGRERGPRPMELLLMGLGGCSGIDIIQILKKARQDVRGFEMTVSGERSDTDPKVFTKIHLELIITGVDIRESAVQRAIQLSADKYCSASIMLGKTAAINHSYEIKPVAD